MTIHKNEGDLDRSLRIITGTVFIVVGLLSSSWLLIVVGTPLLITGAVGFCGLYSLLGISTCPMPSKKKSSSKKKK